MTSPDTPPQDKKSTFESEHKRISDDTASHAAAHDFHEVFSLEAIEQIAPEAIRVSSPLPQPTEPLATQDSRDIDYAKLASPQYLLDTLTNLKNISAGRPELPPQTKTNYYLSREVECSLGLLELDNPLRRILAETAAGVVLSVAANFNGIQELELESRGRKLKGKFGREILQTALENRDKLDEYTSSVTRDIRRDAYISTNFSRPSQANIDQANLVYKMITFGLIPIDTTKPYTPTGSAEVAGLYSGTVAAHSRREALLAASDTAIESLFSHATARAARKAKARHEANKFKELMRYIKNHPA
jgi:hypothetical protein